MRQVSKILSSPAATERFGEAFAASLRPGDVVILHGTLGSGKTTLIRGVARGLGIPTPITSPTFVLRKRYSIADRPMRALNHIDAYRIGSPEELRGILDDLVPQTPDELWLVEWGKRLRSLLVGKRVLLLSLTIRSQQSRAVTVTMVGGEKRRGTPDPSPRKG